MPLAPCIFAAVSAPGHFATHEDVGLSGSCRADHYDSCGPHLPPRHHAVVVASRLRLSGATSPGIVAETGVRLGLDTLLRHNNEHIVVIPKLVYAANYLVTSGSNTGLIVYSLAVGIAITALLLFLARELLIDTPWRLLLCALLFPLVMSSAKLTHSYFLGMSGTIWLTADLFVILSAAALARAVTAESQTGCSSRSSPRLSACSLTAPPSTCSSCS